jgi:CrcB protein
MKLFALLTGGAIGTLMRYLLSGWTYKFFNEVFPWGTLFVNLTSAFAIGFLWPLFENWIVSPNIRVFVLIGILGGFSTFSTYVMETINLAREGETALALSNIIISNIAGLVLVYLGMITAKYFFKLA